MADWDNLGRVRTQTRSHVFLNTRLWPLQAPNQLSLKKPIRVFERLGWMLHKCSAESLGQMTRQKLLRNLAAIHWNLHISHIFTELHISAFNSEIFHQCKCLSFSHHLYFSFSDIVLLSVGILMKATSSSNWDATVLMPQGISAVNIGERYIKNTLKNWSD